MFNTTEAKQVFGITGTRPYKERNRTDCRCQTANARMTGPVLEVPELIFTHTFIYKTFDFKHEIEIIISQDTWSSQSNMTYEPMLDGDQTVMILTSPRPSPAQRLSLGGRQPTRPGVTAAQQ